MEEFHNPTGHPEIVDAVWVSFYEYLKRLGNVYGTGKMYSPEELISYIEKIRKGEMDIQYLPRANGIRESVASMLSKQN